MNIRSFLPLLFVCSFAAAPAFAQVSAVRIRVEQVNKSDSDKHAKTQSRSLKLHVTNGGPAVEAKIKYTLFGKTAGKDIVSVKDGEKAVSLPTNGTEVVETETGSATFVEEHFAKKKKVEASGTKMVGYGVQVSVADKVVAEVYDPVSLKENFGKTVTMPKPEPKKK